MEEIEVKILDINAETVRNKLCQLGAEKVSDEKIKARLYDYPGKSLDKKDEMVRLRTKNGTAELTFKGGKKPGKFKRREEIETNVGSFDEAEKILKKMGLKVMREYHKRRESYRLGKIKFEIDKYDEIPAFVEIEAPDECEVKKGVEMLGYTMGDTNTLTAPEVFRKYGV